ncbi:NADH-quinone oxidoreductase subunit C [Streptomyces griseochromogenes]|uniref:NADH-quinone oxidoreductase subunit C n=1 Tax=Streptomyces griseochromogenes TaxID=68214 RepID=UPI0037B7ECE7
MNTPGWLPAPAEELFGAEATAEESYELLTVDVPPSSWLTALETARTTLSCTYFDWLSAVDEPGTGFRVSAHVVALWPVRRLLLRTTVPHDAPTLPSAVGVYAGAAWHERETHEMFGVGFENHPGLDHLLLPETFEGHPLRKDFVLAARVAKAWPGAKEPGEPAAGAAHGGPKRRQMLPPGVPDPNEWGPLKGQLPPAPARPARGAGRAAGERPVRAAAERATAAGERPVRRTRAAAEGSAGQAAEEAAGGAGARPRRTRSASEGSVSQAAAQPAAEAPAAPEPGPAPTGPRRARSALEGSASQRAQAPEPQSSTEPEEPDGSARPSTAPRSSDAPWHHARPAFDAGQKAKPEPEQAPESRQTPEPEQAPEANRAPEPQPEVHEASEASEASEAPEVSEASEAPEVSEASEAPKVSEAPEAPAAPEDHNTPDEPTGGPQ